MTVPFATLMLFLAALRVRIILKRIRILPFTLMRNRILPFNADADPDPYPTTNFFPDLDPPIAPKRPSMASTFSLWCGSGSCLSLCCGSGSAFHFDADPDPASQNDADPNPASQNDSDPDPQHCFFVNKKLFLCAVGIRHSFATRDFFHRKNVPMFTKIISPSFTFIHTFSLSAKALWKHLH